VSLLDGGVRDDLALPLDTLGSFLSVSVDRTN